MNEPPGLPPSSSASTVRPSASHRRLDPLARGEPEMRFPSPSKDRHRSQSSTSLSALAAGTSSRSGKAVGEGSSPGGSLSRFTSFFGAGAAAAGAGGGGGGGKARMGLPRSASSNEVMTASAWRGGREEGDFADGRKASDASWISSSSAVRFDLPASAQAGPSHGEPLHVRQRSSTTYSSYSRSTASSTVFSQTPARGHAQHPSSVTSLHPASLSLARTCSSTSSSAASSDFPPTPAQNAASTGSVVYRSRSSSSVVNLPLPSRKGKEPEHLPPLGPETSWRAGLPVLSPVSASQPIGGGGARRTSMPAVVDPRFTFPMRRGGPNGSGSGSGSGGGSQGAGVGLGQGRAPQPPLGLGFGPEVDEVGRTSGSWARDVASKGGGMSYIASLGSLPLVDGSGRQLPSHRSYAPSPVLSDSPARSSPDLTSPSLAAFSPTRPFSPTSPLTSTFTTPEVSSSKLLPAFFPATPPKPKPKPARRGTFSARRRKSSTTRASSPRGRPRRRSNASATSSVRGGLSRSSSLPNLRSGAVTDDDEVFRRPSIPFSTFQPRAPRTRSPQQERRSRDSLRRDEIPIIFPSKRGTAPQVKPRTSPQKPPRPPKSAQRSHERKSSRNVIASGPCEAFTFAHPRIVVVSGSPASSIAGEDAPAPDGIARPLSPLRRDKGKARAVREGPLTDGELDAILDEADRSSVRRVMLENEASRAERAAWSDSATKALGFGLSLRMADRERERRDSAAAVKRKAERRRVRHDVERRKRQQAGTESEWEEDFEGGRRGGRRRRSASVGAVLSGAGTPHPSPPMPTSFEPFTQFGRKLSLKRSRSRGKSQDRRASDAGASATPASVGLGIVGSIRKKASVEASRPNTASTTATAGTTAAPLTPKTATVRGKPIRHLQTSQSVDSLYDRANVAPGPSQRAAALTDGVETEYGQAVSSPPDQPSPTKAETRRPSVQTQNPFLTLPPHLHHLLRSPERGRYVPSRPAPPIPSAAAANRHGITHSPSLPVLAERDSNRRTSADSTASAARLSLALEEQLRASQRNSLVKPIAALPVATTAPLAWQARDESGPLAPEAKAVPPPAVSSAPSLSMSRSAPSLSGLADLSPVREGGSEESSARRPGSSFASWITTSDDPFKVRVAGPASPTSPTSPVKPSPPRSARTASSPRVGRHSRASSGSSAVQVDLESDFNNLFFSPPRPARTTRRPPSIDTSSIEAPAAVEQEKVRIGEVAVSPVAMQHRPFSMLSHEATPGEEREELDFAAAADYEARRRRTAQKSLEALVLMPSSVDTAPSVYLSADEPSTYSTAVSGPGFLARAPLDRQTSFDTRPSTSQSASYATADEGASTDFETSDLPDIVFPADSPAAQPLALPPARPLPTPAQTPWPATSWAREFLGSYEGTQAPRQALPPLVPTTQAERRVSGESGSGSGHSFLQLDEDPELERPIRSPASFIDFSPPSSSPNSPIDRTPVATFPLSPTASQSPMSMNSPRFPDPFNRTSYLSVNSTHFVDPSRSSSGSVGSGSHYSALDDRLDDFPHPPQSGAEDSASDGDDERDEDEDDEGGDTTFVVSRPSVDVDDRTIELGAPSARSSGVPSSTSFRSRSHSSLSLRTVQTPERDSRQSSEDEADGIRRFSSIRPHNLSLLPTTTERPMSSQSSQSYLDLDESAESGKEQAQARRTSGSTFHTFFSSNRAEPQPYPDFSAFRRHRDSASYSLSEEAERL
ncbi:hypothetical protein JCM6882_003528 [Rhodosporidiobolus microsporus]